MPTTRLSLKDAQVYFDSKGPLANELRAAASKGLFSAALRAKRDIVSRVIGNLGARKPVDRGIYRAGWQVERLPNGAAIYNAVPTAVLVEDGVKGSNVVASTKAHVALAEWVRRKLGGLSEKEAWGVAGAILGAMKKRGIFNRGTGFGILKNYTRSTLPSVIKEECEREIAKAMAG